LAELECSFGPRHGWPDRAALSEILVEAEGIGELAVALAKPQALRGR